MTATIRAQRPGSSRVCASAESSFADATAAGQTLMWAPEGAGDFADVAWVIAAQLGNGPGVRGIDVHRVQDSGSLHAQVTADNPAYVRDTAARHDWRLYEPDASYATAYGTLGEIQVSVTWIAPTCSTDLDTWGVGS